MLAHAVALYKQLHDGHMPPEEYRKGAYAIAEAAIRKAKGDAG